MNGAAGRLHMFRMQMRWWRSQTGTEYAGFVTTGRREGAGVDD